MGNRYSDLPGWPALMRAGLAAAYLDLDPEEFARAVRCLDLPGPRLFAGEERWSRTTLDAFIHGEPEATGQKVEDRISAIIDAMEV